MAQDGEAEVWMKPLEGGRVACALFNRGDSPRTVKASLATLGFRGPVRARDLWRKQDLGALKDSYSAEVPAHGATLLLLRP